MLGTKTNTVETTPRGGTDPLVLVADVCKTFHDGTLVAHILAGVAFDLRRGETTSLVGASGSGKSTLLGLVAGLMPPDSGSIVFDGVDVAAADDSARARLRAQRIGVVVQSANLIPFLTASENVEFAVRLAGQPRRRGRARVQDLLAELGLCGRGDHLPRQLSGGEAQRVALAMALVNDPELLLADEVTGELDSATAERVMETIFQQCADRRLTLLFVTHERELAARAQNHLRLVDGGVHRL